MHMNFTGRFAAVAVFASCLVLSNGFAQSTSPAQNQQPQDQSQPPATGVSHPPADDTIQADEDARPPAVTPAAKPSAAVRMTSRKPVVATPRTGDPDYGMVPSVPNSTTASLTHRPFNPDDEMVNVVPSDSNELASGTNIRVRLSQGLSTKDTQPGTRFSAVVDKDVYKEGRVIIPAGAEMRGRVVAVSQGTTFVPLPPFVFAPTPSFCPTGPPTTSTQRRCSRKHPIPAPTTRVGFRLVRITRKTLSSTVQARAPAL